MTTALLASLVAMAGAHFGAHHQAGPTGYLSQPAGGGPCVLVLHPWWGLNKDTQALCDRLSKAGFVAFAPDLFEGKTAKTEAEAMALLKREGSRDAEITKIVRDSARYLAGRTPKGPISVVGLSYGAYYALGLSVSQPALVRSVVVFYGTGPQDFAKSKASYLGHFAAKDEFNSKKDVDAMVARLRKAGRPTTVYTYPGVGHWFFEPSVKKAYNKAASDLAWKRTVAFLRH